MIIRPSGGCFICQIDRPNCSNRLNLRSPRFSTNLSNTVKQPDSLGSVPRLTHSSRSNTFRQVRIANPVFVPSLSWVKRCSNAPAFYASRTGAFSVCNSWGVGNQSLLSFLKRGSRSGIPSLGNVVKWKYRGQTL
jgi:hypothetical protein